MEMQQREKRSSYTKRLPTLNHPPVIHRADEELKNRLSVGTQEDMKRAERESSDYSIIRAVQQAAESADLAEKKSALGGIEACLVNMGIPWFVDSASLARHAAHEKAKAVKFLEDLLKDTVHKRDESFRALKMSTVNRQKYLQRVTDMLVLRNSGDSEFDESHLKLALFEANQYTMINEEEENKYKQKLLEERQIKNAIHLCCNNASDTTEKIADIFHTLSRSLGRRVASGNDKRTDKIQDAISDMMESQSSNSATMDLHNIDPYADTNENIDSLLYKNITSIEKLCAERAGKVSDSKFPRVPDHAITNDDDDDTDPSSSSGGLVDLNQLIDRQSPQPVGIILDSPLDHSTKPLPPDHDEILL